MTTRPLPIGLSDLVILCGLLGGIASVALLAFPRVKRVSSFWLLQAAGWIVYGAAKYFLNPTGYPTVARAAWLVTLGFGVTLLLREVYRRIPARFGYPALALTAIVLSPVSALLWLFVFDGAMPETAVVLNKSSVLLAWSALYIGIRTWLDLAEERTRRLREAECAARTELELLRYQINPHFLFNALNSVSAMVDVDRGRAKQMIRDLSDFFRSSLHGATGDVTLREELRALESYLQIEKTRFEERLVVTMTLDDAAAECLVPSLLLHPLVENAVKHGMKSSPMPLIVDVSATRRGDALSIVVRNSGEWRCDLLPEESECIGLENVRRRIAQRFPRRASFRVGEEEGFVVARIDVRLAEVRELAVVS